jgi:hypothetical protein
MFTEHHRNVQWFVGLAVIVTIIISIISSNVSIRYILGIIEPETAVYDEKFISALNKVANRIPENETLVVSGSGGIITFFTDFPVKTPRNITSLESLVQWMSKHDFNYLVVTPTNEPKLKPLFSKQGLEHLEEYFHKIIGYKTEFNEINLFKRIME